MDSFRMPSAPARTLRGTRDNVPDPSALPRPGLVRPLPLPMGGGPGSGAGNNAAALASAGLADESADGSTSMLTRRYAAAHGAPRPLALSLPVLGANGARTPTSFAPDDSTSSVVRDDELANSSGLLYHAPVFAPIRRRNLNPISESMLAPTPLGQPLGLPRSAPVQSPQLGPGQPASQITPSGANGATLAPPRLQKAKRRLEQGLSDSYSVHASSPLRANLDHTPADTSDDLPVPDAPMDEPCPRETLPAEEESNAGVTMTQKLRVWMHDALKHHLYDTAIFWGDKLLSLERGEEAYNDAYFLALAYFYTHQYRKTVALLTSPLPDSSLDLGAERPPAAAAASAAHVADPLAAALNGTRETALLCLSSRRGSKRKDRAFTVSGTGTASDEDQSLPDRSKPAQTGLSGGEMLPPPPPVRTADPEVEAKCVAQAAAAELDMADEDGCAWLGNVNQCVAAVSAAPLPPRDGPCLVNFSQACRYLASQALVRVGRMHDALDLLGRDAGRWRGSSRAFEKRPALDGGIKLVSSACHLRGLIYLRLDDLDHAKENFLKALALDVKNFDAFAALVEGALVPPDALWDFVQNLDYAAQSEGIVSDSGQRVNELEMVRELYTLRLPPASAEQAQKVGVARVRLAREFGITLQNPDVLLSVAEELYTRLRWEDAHVVSARIMDLAPDHAAALWVHVGSMVHVPRLHPALFALAHRLVTSDPSAAVSWYAVGAWYAATGRWLDARRYFGKASLLDPRSAPVWLAFGHSFALQGESDHAVVAYSTAARKFVQSPLPPVFIAMEHVHQGNFRLARLFLTASHQAGEDPLAQNELGVVEFHAKNYSAARDAFEAALGIARRGKHALGPWVPTLLNLAQTQRLLGDLEASYQSYMLAIELDPHCAPAYLGLGLVQLAEGRLSACITSLHESLALDPRDAAATALLDYALAEWATTAAGLDTHDSAVEHHFATTTTTPSAAANANASATAAATAAPAAAAAAATPPPPLTDALDSSHSVSVGSTSVSHTHDPHPDSRSRSPVSRSHTRSASAGHLSRSQSMLLDESASASDMVFE